MNKIQKMIWRLRYTIYGQYKTRWGLRLWWEFSEVALFEQFELHDEMCWVDDPIDAAKEEIWAACS